MALLKDLTVYGATRFISDAFGNNIYADKHITNGGTSSQFVKGDGTLDSGVYTLNSDIGLYVGGSGNLTANAAQSTNGNVYMTLKAASNYFKHKITGASGISVTSDSSGNVTITGTVYATTTHNHGVSKTAWGQEYVDSSGNLKTISGNMTSVGTITANGNNTITKTTTAATLFQAANSNGAIELLTSTNRGVYDRTADDWLIGTEGTKTWLSRGNVGIGASASTSMLYKLHVNGGVLSNNSSTSYNGFTLQYNSVQYGRFFINTAGTTSTTGEVRLTLGNGTASGTANNAYGRILLYSSSSGYHYINPTETTSGYTHYLPNATGWVATGGNGTTTGAGGVKQFIYLNTSGVLTATTQSLGSSTKPLYLNAGILTECSEMAVSGHTHDDRYVFKYVRNHDVKATQYTGTSFFTTYVSNTTDINAIIERGSWAYTANGYVQTDILKSGTYNFRIHLAGTAIFSVGDSTSHTLLFITPQNNDVTGGSNYSAVNEMMFYTSNGSNYNDAWTRVYTNRNCSVTSTSNSITVKLGSQECSLTNTNTDTKVTQAESTTSNYRPIIMGKDNGVLGKLFINYTDQVYYCQNLLAQASSGVIVSRSQNAGGGIKLYSYNSTNGATQLYGQLTLAKIGTQSTGGAQGAQGEAKLILGNNIARGAATTYDGENNARGCVRLYGQNTHYIDLQYDDAGANNDRNVFVPPYNGGMYLTHTGDKSAVGSGIRPTYVTANGRLNYSSSTVGTSLNPIYLDNGTITISSQYRYSYEGRTLTNYKYKKIASVTIPPNQGVVTHSWIKLSITSGFDTEKSKLGELYIRYITHVDGRHDKHNFSWTYRTKNINLNNFILSIIDDDTNGGSTCEFWILYDVRHDGYMFKVIDSGSNRNENGILGWVLETSKINTGGQKNAPTGTLYYSNDAILDGYISYSCCSYLTQSIETSSNTSYYLLFGNKRITTGNKTTLTYAYTNGSLNYNPNSNVLTAGTFNGKSTNIMPVLKSTGSNSYYILFSDNYNNTNFNIGAYTYLSTGLYYTPSTNSITANKFIGTATNANNADYIKITAKPYSADNNAYYISFHPFNTTNYYPSYINTAFYYNPHLNIAYVGLHDTNLKWGVINLENGAFGPISTLFNMNMKGNKFAGLTETLSLITYTTNWTSSSATWKNYTATNLEKKNLFTVTTNKTFRTGGVSGNLGSGTNAKKRRLRVYVYSTPNNSGTGCLLYVLINKFHLYVSTNYGTNCKVTIKCAIQADMNDYYANHSTESKNPPNDSLFTMTVCEGQTISGWSGWNEINVPVFNIVRNWTVNGVAKSGTIKNLITYSNDPNLQVGCIMFEFWNDGISTSSSADPSTAGLLLYNIFAFGTMWWAACSNIARTDHVYSFDGDMNTTFPANVQVNGTITSNGIVTAPTFKGKTTNIMPVSTSEDNSYYILFSDKYNTSSFNSGAYAYINTSLLYNPNTHVLTANSFNGVSFTGTSAKANTILINSTNTSKTYYLTFVNATSSYRYTYVDENLKYNASTNVLTAGNFDGKIKAKESSTSTANSYVLLGQYSSSSTYTDITYQSFTSSIYGGLRYNSAEKRLFTYNLCTYIINTSYIETNLKDYYWEEHNIHFGYGHNTHTTEVLFWTSKGNILNYLPNDVVSRHLNAKINESGVTSFNQLTIQSSDYANFIKLTSNYNSELHGNISLLNNGNHGLLITDNYSRDIVKICKTDDMFNYTSDNYNEINNIKHYSTLCSYYKDFQFSSGIKYTQNLYSSNTSFQCTGSDFSKPFRGNYVCWLARHHNQVPSLIEFNYRGDSSTPNPANHVKWVGLPVPNVNLHGSIITILGRPWDSSNIYIGVAKYEQNSTYTPTDSTTGSVSNCEKYFNISKRWFIKENGESIRYFDTELQSSRTIQFICSYIGDVDYTYVGFTGSSEYNEYWTPYVWRLLLYGD